MTNPAQVARRLVALVLIAVGLLLAAPATSGAKDKRYLDEMFKVSVKRDLVYGLGPASEYSEPQPLELDLYRPKRDDLEKRPVAIFAHGGGFGFGDKGSGPSPDLARLFARTGYVAASINYRLLAPGGCTGSNVTAQCYNAAIEAVHDGQAAVRYFRRRANKLGIDKKRIAIGGESAGAILASGVGVLEDQPGASGNPGPSSAVQGFVSISGGLPGGLFVDADSAPGLLFASTDDSIVPYSWSVETANALRSFDVPAKLVTFQSNVHVPFEQFRSKIERASLKTLYRYLELG